MSEERFKSLRITLSDEALARLKRIKERGRFRSYSSAIEETIRAMFELMPIYSTAIKRRERKGQLSRDDLQYFFDQCMAFLYRFVRE